MGKIRIGWLYFHWWTSFFTSPPLTRADSIHFSSKLFSHYFWTFFTKIVKLYTLIDDKSRYVDVLSTVSSMDQVTPQWLQSRQTDRQKDRKKERQKDRKTNMQIDRMAEKTQQTESGRHHLDELSNFGRLHFENLKLKMFFFFQMTRYIFSVGMFLSPSLFFFLLFQINFFKSLFCKCFKLILIFPFSGFQKNHEKLFKKFKLTEPAWIIWNIFSSEFDSFQFVGSWT